jgi:hypothetical protein
MYRLEPDDIQGMLADAARVLTQPKDKEVMRRLISSTRATDPKEWNKRQIAEMLGKAGKMHEAEMVVHDIEVAWQRGDACLRMSRALHEVGDKYNSRCILHVAAKEAILGQESESQQDRLDAAAVLAEVATFMHELGQADEAKCIAEKITDEMRRQQFLQYLRTVEPEPVDEEPAKATNEV